MKANASDIYEFMPDNYFEYSQAPVIRIVYEEGLATRQEEGAYKLYFGANLFKDNKHYQIVAFSGLDYYGSLIQVSCDIVDFKLEFAHNLV